MAAGLFGFVYNTLRPRVNDPHNQKYWLPEKLEELNAPESSEKLLPLKASTWDLGILQNQGGITLRDAFKASWWALIGSAMKKATRPPNFTLQDYTPIACPDDPFPHLSMSNVVIDGLQNVFVLPSPLTEPSAAGYRTVIALQVGYYNGQNTGQEPRPQLPELEITGRYRLSQCVCAAAKASPSQCTDLQLSLKGVTWPTETITGSGNIVVKLVNTCLDATVTIRSVNDSGQRSLQVAVENLQLRGASANTKPELVLLEDKLTIDAHVNPYFKGLIQAQVINAFSHPATSEAIVESLNTTLNEPAKRQQLANMLNQQFNKILDDTVGAVGSGQLPSDAQQQAPNVVDQYLFDRVRFALNAPNSNYYLPKGICSSTNPLLEPLSIDQISLGDQNYEGLQLQNLQVTQIQIIGLSNSVAPADQLIFKEDAADAVLALSTLNPPPTITFEQNGSVITRQVAAPPLTMKGQFSMQAQDVGLLDGRITTVIDRACVNLALTPTGQDIDNLQVTFQHVQLAANSNAITIDLNVDAEFKDIINAVLNQDGIKQKILQGINDEAAGHLSAIGQQTTNHLKSIIQSKLNS
jgi:hypothetical protein